MLRDGLTLAIQLGISYLEVELDAKAIVEMLSNIGSFNRKFSPLLYDYRSLLARLTQVWVAHVYRKVNKCADFLAKKGCSMREDFVIFDVSPSDDLDKLLVFDVNGLYCYRQVVTTLASIVSL